MNQRVEMQKAPVDIAQSFPHSHPPLGHLCWRWTPTGLRDLTQVRTNFREGVGRRAGTGTIDVLRLQEAVAALDELTSNALRHGDPPVTVEVRQTDRGLLLRVEDLASTRPPQPTADRDPSRGGMGLGIVTSTSLGRGWFTADDRKVVWAEVPRPWSP